MSEDRGFTLVELLLVVLILGSIAGIGLAASAALHNTTVDACEDANRRIGVIADVAADAGVTGDVYRDASDNCGALVAAPSLRPVVLAAPAVAAALLLAIRRRWFSP